MLVEDDESLGSHQRYPGCTDGTSIYIPMARRANHFTIQTSICILDVMLPQQDGFDLAMEIRKQSDCAIVSSRQRARRRQDPGFQIGADDYVCKPFGIQNSNTGLKQSKDLRRILSDKASLWMSQVNLDVHNLLNSNGVVRLTYGMLLQMFSPLWQTSSAMCSLRPFGRTMVSSSAKYGRVRFKLRKYLSNDRAQDRKYPWHSYIMKIVNLTDMEGVIAPASVQWPPLYIFE
jgi:response regulator of citrate/malate metabolism